VSVSTRHLTQLSGTAQDATIRQRGQNRNFHPLLNMQIAPRLALGFLIPLLLAVLAIGNVGWQNQQLQGRETIFYNSLIQGNILLHTAIDDFDQLRGNMLGMLSDAAKPGTSLQTLSEDENSINLYTGNIEATLNNYVQQDLFARYPDLTDLFAQTGRHNWRRAFFNHLLIAPLNRTIAFSELNQMTVTVGHYLEFDVV